MMVAVAGWYSSSACASVVASAEEEEEEEEEGAVACFPAPVAFAPVQHSPMFGQRASSHTVASFKSRSRDLMAV
jgi:hypothetical protein